MVELSSIPLDDGGAYDLSAFTDGSTLVLDSVQSKVLPTTRRSIPNALTQRSGAPDDEFLALNELVLARIPRSVVRLELNVAGPTVVHLSFNGRPGPDDSAHALKEVVLRSRPGIGVLLGGQPAEATYVDGPLLGRVVWRGVADQDVVIDYPLRLKEVVMLGTSTHVEVAAIHCTRLVVNRSAVRLTLGPAAPNRDCWGPNVIGEIEGGQTTGLRIEAPDGLEVGALPPGVSVSVGKHKRLVVGRDQEVAAEALSIIGGTMLLRNGRVEGLHASGVEAIEVGEPAKQEDKPAAIMTNALVAARRQEIGVPTIVGLSGDTDKMVVRAECIVAGDNSRGFQATDLFVERNAWLSGVDVIGLSIDSIARIGTESNVRMWVPMSTAVARKRFETALVGLQPIALDQEATRRAMLLRAAGESAQSGHSLAVLREAERDVRRRLLPLRSRERRLLELSRWTIGYGERIGWPLGVGAGLLALLAFCDIGWGRLTSKAFVRGFTDHHRYEHLLQFATPGVSVFGLDPYPGLWGVLAKVVSTVFLASAVSAGVKVLRRKE